MLQGPAAVFAAGPFLKKFVAACPPVNRSPGTGGTLWMNEKILYCKTQRSGLNGAPLRRL
jgi:hypothetical protein